MCYNGTSFFTVHPYTHPYTHPHTHTPIHPYTHTHTHTHTHPHTLTHTHTHTQQETETLWENLSSTEEVLIRKHAFPIAIKGITRSCLGDIFENDDELRRLTDAYHIYWRTMEVCGRECVGGSVGASVECVGGSECVRGE